MRVEVLCTGDELLGGSVSDTNTAMFASLLQGVGAVIARTTVVGDAQQDIVDAVREVTARADVVLLCGGLGPTDDDRTTAAVALAAGVPTHEDALALRRLEERLTRFGRMVTPNNRRQAQVPHGATVLHTTVGTAAGYTLQVGGARLFVMPGVPQEARWFCETYVVPHVRQRTATIHGTRLLRCVGIAEGELDQRVAGLSSEVPGISLHFRTVFPENHLKLVARGADAAEVEERLQRALHLAAHRLGDVVVSTDGRSLPRVLMDLLVERGETLSTAESCTGGMVAAWMTDEPGSSRVFQGAVVAYANSVKTQQLGVKEETMAAHGAVSGPVAEQMAQGARQRLGSTWALSLTGVAGPDGGSAEKPVGTVWMGLAGPSGVTSRMVLHAGDRARVRTSAATNALMMLRQALTAPPG